MTIFALIVTNIRFIEYSTANAVLIVRSRTSLFCRLVKNCYLRDFFLKNDPNIANIYLFNFFAEINFVDGLFEVFCRTELAILVNIAEVSLYKCGIKVNE